MGAGRKEEKARHAGWSDLNIARETPNGSLRNCDAPFVLLDDARIGRKSMLYHELVDVATAHFVDEVRPALETARQAVRRGLHVAGYVGYGAGLALEPRLANLAAGLASCFGWGFLRGATRLNLMKRGARSVGGFCRGGMRLRMPLPWSARWGIFGKGIFIRSIFRLRLMWNFRRIRWLIMRICGGRSGQVGGGWCIRGRDGSCRVRRSCFSVSKAGGCWASR